MNKKIASKDTQCSKKCRIRLKGSAILKKACQDEQQNQTTTTTTTNINYTQNVCPLKKTY